MRKAIFVILDIIAVMISWFLNKSILWGIIHFIFGPVYLLYSLLTGQLDNGVISNAINFYFQ